MGARIEELLGQIRAAGDPGTAEVAEEVVRLVVELYGAGLGGRWSWPAPRP